MVNSDLVLVAKLTEELAVIRNGVVEVARNLDGLALDLLGELKDVCLGLLDVLRLTGNLDL